MSLSLTGLFLFSFGWILTTLFLILRVKRLEKNASETTECLANLTKLLKENKTI